MISLLLSPEQSSEMSINKIKIDFVHYSENCFTLSRLFVVELSEMFCLFAFKTDKIGVAHLLFFIKKGCSSGKVSIVIRKIYTIKVSRNQQNQMYSLVTCKSNKFVIEFHSQFNHLETEEFR